MVISAEQYFFYIIRNNNIYLSFNDFRESEYFGYAGNAAGAFTSSLFFFMPIIRYIFLIIFTYFIILLEDYLLYQELV